DLAKEGQQLARGDLCHGTVTEHRKGEVEQPPLLGERHVSATLTFQLGDHLLGNGTEAAVRRSLTDLPLDLALRRWVDALRQELFRLVSPAASPRKRDSRIAAERQRFLLARKPIGQTPQLAACRLDKQMQSASIRQLLRPRTRLGIPCSGVRK